MAKTQVTCALDGGTFDGTPSAAKRHIATAKHVGAATALKIKDAAPKYGKAGRDARRAERGAAMQALRDSDAARAAAADGVEVDPAQDAASVAEIAAALADTGPATSIAEALFGFQKELEQELQRRTVDYTWRVKHQADKAAAYYAERVAPVERNVALIRQAVALLSK